MKSILLSFFYFSTSIICFSQAGVLDKTFGDSGRVVSLDFGECYASGIQSSGKIILAGELDAQRAANSLARYNTDGSIDASFGNNGWAILDSPLYGIHYMAMLPNDKFITISYSVMAKYSADGTLDSSFGKNRNGMVSIKIPGYDHKLFIHAIGLQSDGKIVLAGWNGDYLAVVLRYRRDGWLDNSFGNSGISELNLGGLDVIRALAIRPDGKIIIGGSEGLGSSGDFLLARLNADGTRDSSFGVQGRVKTVITASQDVITALSLLPDDKILAAGTLNFNDAQAVVRYKPNGKIDSSFGTNGLAKKAFDGSDLTETSDMEVQPDGKILVAGTLVVLPNRYFNVTRFNANGIIDSSFRKNGSAITNMYHNALCTSMSLQQDGKIILAGMNESDNNTNFAMVRYRNDIGMPVQFIDFNASRQNGLTVMLYPNPVRDVLNIKGLDAGMSYELSVVSAKGSVVAQTKISNTSSYHWNSKSLSKGVYYLSVTSSKNKTTTVKFVKE